MTHPALDVVTDEGEILLALADDFSPTAAEERDGVLTLYFDSRTRRDEAHAALSRARPFATIAPREVDDEDWARRSQANLTPVTIGRLTIAPPWHAPPPGQSSPPGLPALVIIEPSMGFGTGHHATTRLCLRALQAIDVTGGRILDVGTGSGIIAIAARALGAREGLGIDIDPDAVESARANLRLNPALAGPGGDAVHFLVGDIRHMEDSTAADWLGQRRARRARQGAARGTGGPASDRAGVWGGATPVFDVVAANLTGALLSATAALLQARAQPGGRLLLSGLLAPERDDVLSAFTASTIEWEAEEEGWVGLILKR